MDCGDCVDMMIENTQRQDNKSIEDHSKAGAAARLWRLLPSVSSLRFTARSRRPAEWNGVGIGSIVAASSADREITFTESGVWTPVVGVDLPFTNVYRWRLNQDSSIGLEHLRFGPDNPVFLFDLEPAGSGKWLSSSPHLCVDDRYSATLRIFDHGFRLRWLIAGPDKRTTLDYDYWVSK